MGAMARLTAVGDQRGVALLALLLVIAAMGAALAGGGVLWHEVQQREKERELIFVGLQYRDAIRQYYLNSAAGRARYPATLEALLRDERVPQIKRYLRRPYRDPLTNSTRWGLVVAPEGGIMGIYSLATETPIKQTNFPAELGWTEDKKNYADWQFVFVPSLAPVAR